MAPQVYPSDLSAAEWAVLSPLIPAAKLGGRPRSVEIRRILNGILYVLRTGCAWRYLPAEYGPWPTVYYYLRRWRLDGTWEQIALPPAGAGTGADGTQAHPQCRHHR